MPLSLLLILSLSPAILTGWLLHRLDYLLKQRAPKSHSQQPGHGADFWFVVALAGAASALTLALGLSDAASAATLRLLSEEIKPALRLAMARDVVAGPTLEEFGKALPALYFLLRGRFKTQAGAVSLGMAAGVGFAVLENLLVNLTAASTGPAFLSILAFRLLFGPLVHIACATSVSLGLHLLSRDRIRERGLAAALIGCALLIGLGLAQHMLWNASMLWIEWTGLVSLALAPLLLAIVAAVTLLAAMRSSLKDAVNAERVG